MPRPRTPGARCRAAGSRRRRLPCRVRPLGPSAWSAAWATTTATFDVAACWQRHVDAGIGVVLRGTAAYPAALRRRPRAAGHPLPPRRPRRGRRHRGWPSSAPATAPATARPRLRARRATSSAAGVCGRVGPRPRHRRRRPRGRARRRGRRHPIAVVGSGLDVVYPRRNGAAVAAGRRQRAWCWSEAPLGAPAAAWHFPARNRIIAALADVVVVVESHGTGGSLHTVRRGRATRTGRSWRCPGPVRSPASAGTNQLLADGRRRRWPATPTDVLVALGLRPGARRPSAERRPPPRPPTTGPCSTRSGWQPATLEHLAAAHRPLGPRAGVGPGAPRAGRAGSRRAAAGTSGWPSRGG